MKTCYETDEQGLRKLVPLAILVEVPMQMSDEQIVHAMVDMLTNGQDSMREPNPRFTVMPGRRAEDYCEEVDGKQLEVWDALAIRFTGVEVDKTRPVMRHLKSLMQIPAEISTVPIPGLPHLPKKKECERKTCCSTK